MDGSDWVLGPVTWKPRLGERNCFCPWSGHGGSGWRWLTMQWLWVVEGRGPWFHGAKLSSQLRHKLPSADEVSSSCQLRHQAAGWSFLLAGRAICQPRLGSAGRRGIQSPSSHLSPVTRPGTWSDQQSPATYDPSLIQPLGEIIRNTGCRERSSVSPPALSIDQPLANNRSYSDLTAASCWIHRHKAFCYRAKHPSRNIPRYLFCSISADVIFIKVLKPCLLSREARVESEAQTARQDLTIA